MSLVDHALRSGRYRILDEESGVCWRTEVLPRDPDPCDVFLRALHSTSLLDGSGPPPHVIPIRLPDAGRGEAG